MYNCTCIKYIIAIFYLFERRRNKLSLLEFNDIDEYFANATLLIVVKFVYIGLNNNIHAGLIIIFELINI